MTKERKIYMKQYYELNKKQILEKRKKYHNKNKEKIDKEKRKKYYSQYYIKNREKILKLGKQYRIDNKEILQQYRIDNKEIIKIRRKKYSDNNKEIIKQKSKKYWKDRPEKVIAKSIKYRIILKEQTPDLTKKEQKRVKKLYKIRDLLNHNSKDFHVDHIQPITKGGLHHPDNLQILPNWLNQEKSNKWPLTENQQILYEGFSL